jgi:hypothetical protein
MFALRERRRRSKRWQGIRVRAPGCGRGHPCSCNTHSPRPGCCRSAASRNRKPCSSSTPSSLASAATIAGASAGNFSGPGEGVTRQCRDRQQQVGALVKRDGGNLPQIKPFRVHVTLAGKVPHGSHEHTVQSVLWSFTDCALIDSRTGPGGSLYSILDSWSLCTEVRKMPEKKDK